MPPPKHPNNIIITFSKKIIAVLSAVRLLPHIALLLLSPKKDLIWADLDHWGEICADGRPKDVIERVILFVNIMTFVPAFRNVLYLRHRILARLLSLLCRPVSGLEINVDKCGPGLFIQHGFSTTVSADEIGANCWINQHVVIGYANNSIGRPTIGDNVTINAGAKILGAVKIGNNSRVGANSVVLSDVPPDVTVIGVPASIVWKNIKNK